MTMKLKKELLLILIFSMVIAGSCTPDKAKIESQKIQSIEAEKETKRKTEQIAEKKRQEYNDSLSRVFLSAYPEVCNFDSIRNVFTYVFQERLAKSSNRLYLKNVVIQDIEMVGKNYLITAINFYPGVVGKFTIDSQYFEKLAQELKPRGWGRSCRFIIDVKKLIPINSKIVKRVDDLPYKPEGEYLSKEEVSEYVEIESETFTPTSYIIYGNVIDFQVRE